MSQYIVLKYIFLKTEKAPKNFSKIIFQSYFKHYLSEKTFFPLVLFSTCKLKNLDLF